MLTVQETFNPQTDDLRATMATRLPVRDKKQAKAIEAFNAKVAEEDAALGGAVADARGALAITNDDTDDGNLDGVYVAVENLKAVKLSVAKESVGLWRERADLAAAQQKTLATAATKAAEAEVVAVAKAKEGLEAAGSGLESEASWPKNPAVAERTFELKARATTVAAPKITAALDAKSLATAAGQDAIDSKRRGDDARRYLITLANRLAA
jgi:hypothetical protein